MEYSKIKEGLKGYPSTEVQVFITYLQKLETEKSWSGANKGQPKNRWFGYFTEDQAINLFKKVALDGLFIDGDTITLQYKAGVMVSYNYQAYKNKLLNIYPETKFDIQNVYKGDEFTFEKKSGKVIYNHKLNNPFATDREIIGCYCIIKNSRGEFLETLNNTEIQKMRAVAKTHNVWDNWYEEMTLKSVIKRACKRHFKDITTNIEMLDNENYDLEKIDVEISLQKEIEDAGTLEELEAIYKDNINSVKDETQFLRMLTNQKNIINENS